MSILQIAVANPLRHCLDYLPPESVDVETLIPGIRVTVPFRNKNVTGILMGIKPDSHVKKHKLKQCIAILDSEPLFSKEMMQLLSWASLYYHYPIGEVVMNALPTLLRQGKEAVPTKKSLSKKKKSKAENVSSSQQDSKVHAGKLIELNAAQHKAVEKVAASFGEFTTFLLEGVTGSGKTEVYFELIQRLLTPGKQTLLLVPEIGLTPQLVKRFQHRFSAPMAVLHSKLTPRQRLDAWRLAKNGQANIIIGTRSAIFTPLTQLGLIIIDEEHDPSFKQQEGFRYSARDIAIRRAQLENIPIILGSATPALESLHNVKQMRFQLLCLPQRAGNAVLPHFHIIDIKKQRLQEGLSLALLEQMHKHLDNGGQALVFLNRRGFAPTLLCHSCGYVATCKQCDAHLTLHFDPYYLQCHHCTATHPVLKACPHCKATELLPIGTGTERIESALKTHFPDAEIIRIDRDTTRRKGSLQGLLNKIHEPDRNQKQILVGTQMLTKGHHFPDVTLVAVINADSGLLSSDFRATERIAQMLVQVAGRAGRAERPGEVFIQTHHPDHPLLMQLIKKGYTGFAEAALEERRFATLPPMVYFALLRAEANTKKLPITFLEDIRGSMQNTLEKNKEFTLLGPIPSPMERKAGYYRAQLLLQAPKRSILHATIPKVLELIENHNTARKVRWSLDVDPIELF